MIKEKLLKYLIFALIVFVFLSGYLGYTIYQKNKELKMANAVYIQNELSKKEIEILKKDSMVLYHKYAEVTNLNKEKNKILKQKDEKIISLVNTVVSIKEIVDSLKGIAVNEEDTTKVPYYLIGKKYLFSKETKFYSLIDTVTLDNPPFMKRNLTFFQDIGLDVYLTVNSEGSYSGYAKFIPDFVNDYINIKKLEVKLEKDEFYKMLKQPIGWMFFVDGSTVIYSTGEFKLALGISIIRNEQWKMGYRKVLNDNIHLIDFGYRFFSIK